MAKFVVKTTVQVDSPKDWNFSVESTIKYKVERTEKKLKKKFVKKTLLKIPKKPQKYIFFPETLFLKKVHSKSSMHFWQTFSILIV